MIIIVRGTHGSGKSWVVREVIKKWFRPGEMTAYVNYLGREKLMYFHNNGLAVLGNYETACGGGDGIGSAPKCYEAIEQIVKDRSRLHILAEGALLSQDAKWTMLMTKEVRNIFLTTPLELCFKRIHERRALSGNTKPLGTEHTTRRVGAIERIRERLVEANMLCRRATSDQAVGIILEWLKESVNG